MLQPKRFRRKGVQFENQSRLPLSLPALCTLVYGVLYYHLGMWIVVTWPWFVPTSRYSSEYSFLATQLCFVHAGWIVLLLLNLLAMRTRKGALPRRNPIGEWCAIVVASTLLVSSLQMAAAVPAPTDPPHEEGAFEFGYDPGERVWTMEANK